MSIDFYIKAFHNFDGMLLFMLKLREYITTLIMKKIFSLLIIISLLIINYPLKAIASNEGYFVVTAYYSPLSDQKYYLKGNYKDEIRLN
jgi:hypothetical protein